MIEREEKLIEILEKITDVATRALVLERHIANFGPLSRECGEKVREILR